MNWRDIVFCLALVMATAGLMLSVINSGILDERHEPVRYVHPRKRKETVYDRIVASPDSLMDLIDYLSHGHEIGYCPEWQCCMEAMEREEDVPEEECRKCLKTYLEQQIGKDEKLPWEEWE